jgi:hypothetical protein
MTSGDILTAIDDATDGRCACGCGELLTVDSPSAWFATANCQQRWHGERVTDPADVYWRIDAAEYTPDDQLPVPLTNIAPRPAPLGDRPQCIGYRRDGGRCRRSPTAGERTCHLHLPTMPTPDTGWSHWYSAGELRSSPLMTGRFVPNIPFVESSRGLSFSLEPSFLNGRLSEVSMVSNANPAVVLNEYTSGFLAESLAAFQPIFDGLASAMQQITTAFQQAATAFVDAGLLDEQPPADPRARALWLRRHRNTGPREQPFRRRGLH